MTWSLLCPIWKFLDNHTYKTKKSFGDYFVQWLISLKKIQVDESRQLFIGIGEIACTTQIHFCSVEGPLLLSYKITCYETIWVRPTSLSIKINKYLFFGSSYFLQHHGSKSSSPPHTIQLLWVEIQSYNFSKEKRIIPYNNGNRKWTNIGCRKIKVI